MFGKNCKNCGGKVSSKHSFCPHCGVSQKNNENWGMLGKDDATENPFQDPFFRGFNGGILNKMLGSAMKMLEKEMRKSMEFKNNEQTPQPRKNIRLMINGKEIDLNELNKKQIEKKEKSFDQFSKKSLKNFSKLPKKEPKTNIKRFSDKIVYEIILKGIKSLKDVSIIKLENSIEIKAVTKKSAYFKTIPINLPIKNYNFFDEKLVLELEAKN